MKKKLKIAENDKAFPASTHDCFMTSSVTAITKV